MLERATACLKAGAKDSLRCAKQHHCQHSSSKRLLHQTFWTHGAGDLELPPYAVAHPDTPHDLLLGHSGSQKLSRKRQESAIQAHASGAPFLDFLYPPQALAWLKRNSSQQHWERWEKRNARRLPDGFVQASRGYSSSSFRQSRPVILESEQEINQQMEGEDRGQESPASDTILSEDHNAISKDHVDTHESNDAPRTVEQGDVDISQTNAGLIATETTESSASWQSDIAEEEQEMDASSFGDSPADLAEVDQLILADGQVQKDPLRDLRAVLAGLKPLRGQDKTALAWQLYKQLDEFHKQDVRLKNELLVFFGARQNNIADAHCISLYLSMPLDARSLSTYQAAMAAFLRREDQDSALGLHKEALSNLPNSTKITQAIFSHAVRAELVETALEVKEQHDAVLPNQEAIFWLQVSEMPDLPLLAARFAQKSRLHASSVMHGSSNASTGTLLALSARLSEEALSQLVIHPLPENVIQLGLPSRFYTLCDSISDWNPEEAPRIFEHVIISLLQRHDAEPGESTDSRSTHFARAYHIISYFYQRYRKMDGFSPSEPLLTLFLNRLLHRTANRKERRGLHTIGMGTVISDWKKAHAKLSPSAVHMLMSFHAVNGNVTELTESFQYLLQCYPSYADQKDALWTLIDVHARRADVPSAIRAFDEIQRLATTNADTVSTKCWAILLKAHSSADDLEGAFGAFQRMLDTGSEPDARCVGPILRMLAVRGDVDGVEDVLEQYDALSGAARTTYLISSLIMAFNMDNRTLQSEEVLRKAVDDRRAFRITGSLTLCFDTLLQAYAKRNDIGSTVRVYGWMKAEGIHVSSATFTALMRALCMQRQTDGAWKLLTHGLQKEGLQATALHYAVVMEGYNSQGMFQRALEVHKKMLDRKVKPNVAVQKAYFKARAHQEQRTRARSGQDRDDKNNPVPLTNVIEEAQAALQHLDGSELARSHQHLQHHDTSGSAAGEILGSLMMLHAKRRNLETVQQLYELYRENVRKIGTSSGMLPMEILEALMGVSVYAGKYDDVERYWKLAKHQADMFTAPVAVPKFRRFGSQEVETESPAMIKEKMSDSNPKHVIDVAEIGFASRQAVTQGVQTLMPKSDKPPGNQPVPGRRQILSTAARYYFRSLLAQDRIGDLILTFTRLLQQGYTFDSRLWNRVVEFLCSSSPPLALLAFSITEQLLIPNFPGWRRNTKWTPPKSARAQDLEYLEARYLDTRSILVPEYRTMQYLAAALLKLRKREVSGGARRSRKMGRLIGTLAQIREKAPQTYRHVQNMPDVDDYWQNRLLRKQRGGYNFGKR